MIPGTGQSESSSSQHAAQPSHVPPVPPAASAPFAYPQQPAYPHSPIPLGPALAGPSSHPYDARYYPQQASSSYSSPPSRRYGGSFSLSPPPQPPQPQLTGAGPWPGHTPVPIAPIPGPLAQPLLPQAPTANHNPYGPSRSVPDPRSIAYPYTAPIPTPIPLLHPPTVVGSPGQDGGWGYSQSGHGESSSGWWRPGVHPTPGFKVEPVDPKAESGWSGGRNTTSQGVEIGASWDGRGADPLPNAYPPSTSASASSFMHAMNTQTDGPAYSRSVTRLADKPHDFVMHFPPPPTTGLQPSTSLGHPGAYQWDPGPPHSAHSSESFNPEMAERFTDGDGEAPDRTEASGSQIDSRLELDGVSDMTTDGADGVEHAETRRKAKRRTQNKVAQRAFRVRSKIHKREAEEHLSGLESTITAQNRQIAQMSLMIEKLSAENRLLRATTQYGPTSGVTGYAQPFPPLQPGSASVGIDGMGDIDGGIGARAHRGDLSDGHGGGGANMSGGGPSRTSGQM